MMLAFKGFFWWLRGRECACSERESGFDPWVGKISWMRAWQPTPEFLPGEFRGQRSLVGWSSWGLKESDTTEQLEHAGMLAFKVNLD